MRYLNKIIFINSARINYAEINLDGNVHLIGTQGVGKSTLLRAVLFFYNADSVGLGIPREKKSYADYYFPFGNSYIVYEVVRDEGHFCVVSYKSQNRVCFRFFDGPYRQEFFVGADGQVPDQWERIAQRLDARRLAYLRRKVENYTEYRDILYGNFVGKQGETKRYALMESKEYTNIPKTIQNVFLNAKMEADFIKQTIILSLENDVVIELDKYNHHLKGFEMQLGDIRRYHEPKTREQAESILHLLRTIQHLEREKVALAHTLGHAHTRAQAQHLPIAEALAAKEQEQNAAYARRARLQEAHQKEISKIEAEIAILNGKLKEARDLTRKYENEGMPQVLARVQRKPVLEGERLRLQAERDDLLAQQQALSQAFEVRLLQLDNQRHSFENGLQKEQLALDAGLLQFKAEAAARADKLVEELRRQQKEALDHARDIHAQCSHARARLQHEQSLLQKQPFMEAEIYAERETHRELILAENNEKAALADAQRDLEREQAAHQLKEAELLRLHEAEAQALEKKIKAALSEAAAIDRRLAEQESALYGWLSRELPGWEQTIGKVIDQEHILFHTELSPERLPEAQGFYGVSLDLDRITSPIKTVAEYTQAAQQYKEEAQTLQKQAADAQNAFLTKKEAQQKKVNAAIKAIQASIQACRYRLEQNAEAQAQSRLRMDILERDAVSAKAEALAVIAQHLHEAVRAEEEAKEAVQALEQETDKKVRSLLRERDKQIEQESATIRARQADLAEQIAQQAAHFDARRQALLSEQQQELAAQGVDVKYLAQLNAAIQNTETELAYIDRMRDAVAVYLRHKEDLLDRVDEFKIRKQTFENQIDQAQDRLQRSLDKLNAELAAVQAQIDQLAQKLEDLRADLQAMEAFAPTELYQHLAAYIQAPAPDHVAAFTVRQAIDQLKDIHYDRLSRQSALLQRVVVDFLGKFSEQNLFNFKRQHGDLEACLEFAAMLTDFVGERKIERFEKEVNERFSYIISTMGRETSTMLSEAGKIQAVVRRVNEDFVAKNFVGAIKRIELKVEDSKNEIVQLLQRIKQFNDENALQLGTSNLFTTDNQDKKNQEAVDLLKQFLKLTTARAADQRRVTLADSFDLKFRIEENDNDTGWVEKLAHVGSEGTDVLVKAMLNIMLLNVFKEGASRRFKDFKLHCMMDEIGKLHPNNVRGILKFGNERNILLINGSPIENDALAFKYIYKLHKDAQSITRVSRLIAQDIPV